MTASDKLRLYRAYAEKLAEIKSQLHRAEHSLASLQKKSSWNQVQMGYNFDNGVSVHQEDCDREDWMALETLIKSMAVKSVALVQKRFILAVRQMAINVEADILTTGEPEAGN